MTIQEYWTKLVAARLAPESKYAWADSSQYKDGIRIKVWIGKDEYMVLPTTLIDKIDKPIQLRKDGIDLVHLEWRKPTKQDIGKMCWFYDRHNNTITLSELRNYLPNEIVWRYESNCMFYSEAIFATHSRLAPTIKDFKEIYGYNN